jgi:parvulin-like peptidyl-prolyl isomerase
VTVDAASTGFEPRFAIMSNVTQRAITPFLLGIVAVVASMAAEQPVVQAEIVDQVVARVNDGVITQYDVEEATTPYLVQRGMNPKVLEDPQKRSEIYRKVLDKLIERRLIQEEAEAMNLTVPDQQVDQWLKMTRQQQQLSEDQFRTLLGRYGMTYEEYRETVRQNLLRIRLVKVKMGNQISVSQAEVDERFKERFGDEGSNSKAVVLRHILFKPEEDTEEARRSARNRAEKVLTTLEQGETSFAELAKQYSDGSSGERGGLLGTFQQGELNPAFEETAFNLEEGAHSGIVETEYGYHLLKVDEIKSVRNGNVKKKKQQIRQRLRQQKLQNQLDSYVQKLRRDAFVEVKDGALANLN